MQLYQLIWTFANRFIKDYAACWMFRVWEHMNSFAYLLIKSYLKKYVWNLG